ncbi:MAG: hypothetical protein IE909_18005 [Campylobacterales bacterium]|nr:hypothetical protein [Campylobacterales bacterium]
MEQSNSQQYVQKLIEQAKNQKKSKTTTLQVNIEMSQEELKNIKSLVALIRQADKKMTMKEFVYNVLKESGAFEKID